MLAPRVLNFGQEEISWECFETRQCECGEGKRYKLNEFKKSHFSFTFSQSITDNNIDLAQNQERLLNKIIIQYSQLNLTNSTDKLPALSGLA
jgi:hypothetical protein